jgi:hypothetical protein
MTRTSPRWRSFAWRLRRRSIASLAFLDNLDGDADFEPEQEVRIHLPSGRFNRRRGVDDNDLEPSLGATNYINQERAWKRRWNAGPYDTDLEQDDMDREGDGLEAGESDGGNAANWMRPTARAGRIPMGAIGAGYLPPSSWCIARQCGTGTGSVAGNS